MDIKSVLLRNYLPYAKSTIVSRAIPGIDGLKPVQRRILYTMFTMGLLSGDKRKSANIVGEAMKYHPHGDSSIYDAMVRMATTNGSLNTPYVEGKGNFGRVYSDSACAAYRYTEAKLAPVCGEIFEGINSNAVEMINNFDDTRKEPALLPVKFPSILVNASNGIAVALSSSIPCFGMKRVCNATIGILNNSITTDEELAEVLGVPQFTTGGIVNISDKDLLNLCKTGRGTVTITGKADCYTNQIEVTEIPYNTTCETIVKEIVEYVKSGELKEVTEVLDQTDLKGLKISITVKKGYDTALTLQKIYRLTSLRSKMSFYTRVIVDNKCKSFGFMELLNAWVDFRLSTIQRMYEFKLKNRLEDVHRLESWEKINIDIIKVAHLIADSTEEEAKAKLMSEYGLDEGQADYILGMMIKQFTKDNLDKKLKELKKARDESAEYKMIVEDKGSRKKIIIKELEEISNKYGEADKTEKADEVSDDSNIIEEARKISNANVYVTLSKNGYLKRYMTTSDIMKVVDDVDDPEVRRWFVPNNGYILVFDVEGTVNRILVDSIETGRAKSKTRVNEMVYLPSMNDIVLVDAAGDFSKNQVFVREDGTAEVIPYCTLAGNRSKYKNVIDSCKNMRVIPVEEHQFFFITNKRKANYSDTVGCDGFDTRRRFRVARLGNGETFMGLQYASNVPDISSINIDKYKKDYTVTIGDDVLWDGAVNPKVKKKEQKKKDKEAVEE